MFTPTVISFAIAQATLSITTERSEWRNLFKDVSTALDMTGVNSYIKTFFYDSFIEVSAPVENARKKILTVFVSV